MGLISFLADLRATHQVDELTQQLARQTYGVLRDLCEARMPGMTHAEARGYVWAKARPIISTQVAAVAIAQPALGPGALAMLSERTHDRVVRTVVSDLMRERAQQMHRRRAA
jgi:hypothetical protein